MEPKLLDKSDNPDGKIKLLGENFVQGAKVVLTMTGEKTRVIDISKTAPGLDNDVDGTVIDLKDMKNGTWTIEWTNPGPGENGLYPCPPAKLPIEVQD